MPGSDALHSALSGTNIHVAYAWSYADQAAREGASGFAAGDVGKLALQEDDNSLWLLTATTPTWAAVAGSGSGFTGFDEGASAYHDADQTVDTATLTALALNSELWDTDGCHDLVTANSRLTCKTAGTYLIIGHAHFATTNTTNGKMAMLRKNGDTQMAQAQDYGRDPRLCVMTLAQLEINDYVELVIYQSTGGPVTMLHTAGPTAPQLMMHRIG